MEFVTLNDGNKMPVAGYGVFQMATDDSTAQAVADAIKAGYRLIDTAQVYDNEVAVGKGIKMSGVDREELFVTSKLWLSDYEYDAAMAQIDKALSDMGLEYFDLYLLHQPVGNVYSAWRALEDAQKAGKIKSIGVSNFHNDRLVDLGLFNDVKPAVNQIEINPFFQRESELSVMADEGVVAEAWAPFAEGKNGIFTNETLVAIAQAHNKTVGQVILRWLTQRGIVALAKTVRPERMRENIDIFDFKLTDEEMKLVAELNTNTSQFFDHRDPEMVKYLAARH